MNDKVSIILPIYNAEKTIARTIESIIKQTYKNIELILVNDGSEDESEKICLEYANKNANIKLFNKKNAGVSSARNFALGKATGKYVTFIDSDDCYHEKYVESMVYNLINKNVDMVICGYKRCNALKKKEVSISLLDKVYSQNEYNHLIEECQKKNLFNQVWNKIFLKNIIDKYSLCFDESLSLGEDFKFVINYIKYAKKVYITNDILYIYTNSIDGLNVKYRKNRLYINLDNLKLLEKYYQANLFNTNYINKKYILTILSGIKNISANPNKKEIISELKELKKNNFIKEKLNSNISLKYNIIAKILKISGVNLLKFYGKALILYDKYYIKKKLGY